MSDLIPAIVEVMRDDLSLNFVPKSYHRSPGVTGEERNDLGYDSVI